jgi:hypothetical protein
MYLDENLLREVTVCNCPQGKHLTYFLVFQIKLTYHDGTPVQDANNPVTVRYGYTYDQNLYTEGKHELSKHGMVMLEFYPPLENATVLGIEVST